ncbi:MAG: carboxypeptidase-like regulatory domain-containing protein [Promethearchaeota archaeon]
MMDNNFKKITIITILILVGLVPIIFTDDIIYYNTLENNNQSLGTNLNTSLFSKDDYVPILEAPLQGLGNISITKFSFNEEGLFNYSYFYPNLDDDLISGALNITYLSTTYLETVKIAHFNNLDESLPQSDRIIVLLNESISIQYNSSIENSERFLIYNPKLYPRNLKQVFIQNQSDTNIVELSEEDYSLDYIDYLKFNYQNYFGTNFHNFSMYFIFEYDLIPQDWELIQSSEETLTMTQQEQSFTPRFYYNFNLTGTKLTNNVTAPATPADNLVVEVIIDPLDKTLFYDHILKINDQNILDFLEQDNKINVTISADAKLFSLEFKLNFTLRFEDPVDFSWAIDRLIGDRNIRQRIYFPSLIAGPDHIFLRNITLLESTLILDQVQKDEMDKFIGNSSLFKRPVNCYDVVTSITQGTIDDSLIFTENAIKRKGLKLTIPYLIVGETNPFSVNYDATNDLKIIITDNIRMPLIGYRIELLYFGKKYGTYISNNLTQPMATTYSDENGVVLIENVPNGNYSVRIYQENTMIFETIINTFRDINSIKTDIFHFPLLILIFGGLSGILFLIGLVFYFKYNKHK